MTRLEAAEVLDAFEAEHGHTGASASFDGGQWVVWEPETGTHYTAPDRAPVRFTEIG